MGMEKEEKKNKIGLFFAKGSCVRICLRRSPSSSCPSVPRFPARGVGNRKSENHDKGGKQSLKNAHSASNCCSLAFLLPASTRKGCALEAGWGRQQVPEHGGSSWIAPCVL